MHSSTAWQQLKECFLTVEAIRQVDRLAIERYGLNSLVLMENAALGCVQWLTNRFQSPNAVILCGRGNNGGDGLAIARHLRLAGWPCHIVQLGPIDKLSADAASNWRVLTAVRENDMTVFNEPHFNGPNSAEVDAAISARIQSADVIVDALLGSGAIGAPRFPISDWIRWSNASRGTRVAIDIPSGLDASSGLPADPTFQAHATLTFVAHKVGFAALAAQPYLGDVEVLPIGIPVELVEELLRENALPHSPDAP